MRPSSSRTSRPAAVETTNTTQTQNNVEVKRTLSYTMFNLLMNPTSPTTYAIPRIGFDYLPIDGLTVGGSLGFSTASGEVKQEARAVVQVIEAVESWLAADGVASAKLSVGDRSYTMLGPAHRPYPAPQASPS